jgi:exopolysaccharide production protein ExoY
MEGFVRRAQAEVVYESSFATLEGDAIAAESIFSTDYAAYDEAPTDSWRYRYVKRAFDFSCALLLTLIFALPGLLIAAAIVLTSKGPVFYRERRIGRYGRPFQIWKFRSMHPNAAKLAHVGEPQSGAKVLEWRMKKHLRDPRITAVGRVLRSLSLDELPQLLNVLRGEMSLIGPRPIVKSETVFYGDLLSYYLAATPGLSGLWQVSGRSGVDYDERAQLDASYVQSWSLRADAGIFFRTIPAVLSRVGAS